MLGDIVSGHPAARADPTYARPSTIEDQIDWLRAAGFEATVAWTDRDLAVLVADRPGA